MKLFLPVHFMLAALLAAHVQADFDVKEIRKYQSHQLLRGMDENVKDHFNWDNLGESSSSQDLNVPYADALQQDTQRFIHDVREWVADEVGEKHADDLLLRTQFTLKTKGEPSLADEPCGEPVAHRTFEVLKDFVKDPKHAKLKKKDVEHITWHPSSSCLYRENSLEVDGGSHVDFVVSCGEETLVSAASASGGVTKKFFWKNVEASGAFVGVDLLNGTVKAVAASGNLAPVLKLRMLPDDYKHTMRKLQRKVRQCAEEKKLKVKGVVGGGWRQEYTYYGSFGGPSMTYVLGYADAFELSFEDESTPAPTSLPPAPASEEPSETPAVTVAPVTEVPATDAPVSEEPATEAPASEAPASEEPATEAPASEEPATEAPASEEPATEAPASEEPASEAPASEEPASEAPASEEPATEAPASEEPATEAPSEEPATEAPASEEPVTEAPASEEPATGAPATEEPATEAPASEEPATGAPASEAPASEEPATEAPASEEPATEAPATEEPATEAPATEAPATEAPATEAPATEAPASEEPGTDAPATEEPATEAPVSEEPSTDAPVSEQPASEASASEEPPATEAPESVEPATDAPATEEPSTEAPVSEEPPSEAPVSEEPVMETPVSDEPASEVPSTETASDAPLPSIEADFSGSGDVASSGSGVSAEPDIESVAPAQIISTDSPVDLLDSSVDGNDESASGNALTQPLSESGVPYAYSSTDGSDSIIEEPSSVPVSNEVAMPSTSTEFASTDLKRLSEMTSSMYLQTGVKCTGHSSEQSCLMQSAFAKFSHGEFADSKFTTSDVNEYPMPHNALTSFPVGALVLVAVVVGTIQLRTRLRRNGYQPIQSLS